MLRYSLSLLASVFLLVPSVHAQSTPAPSSCGLDGIHSSVATNPFFMPSPFATTIINVPVFFHVVTATDGTGNVTDAQVSAQIDALNAANMIDESGNGFTFYLVGTSRTANDAWFTGFDNNIDPSVAVTEPEALSALAQDPAHILNLYSADLQTNGYNGYARFPFPLQYTIGGPVHDWPEDSFWHSALVDYRVMPGGSDPDYNLGDLGVHEVGHYLGLYHTFQGWCSGNTPATCETEGDLVCDTAQQRAAHRNCANPATNCPAGPPASQNNYMDYVNDVCATTMTSGQVQRGLGITAEYRPSLGGAPTLTRVSANVDVTLEPGQTFAYDAAERVDVFGTLDAPATTFTAANATDGWYGMYVSGSGADLHMDDSALTGVVFPDVVYKKPNSALTVLNGAHATLTNGSEVSGALRAQGIEVYDATVLIEGSETKVLFNDLTGVVAMPGATVEIRNGAQVDANVGGGVYASGKGALVELDRASVSDNEGAGISATESASVVTTSAGTGSDRTRVNDNHSGLSADGGGSINLGTCTGGTCTNAGHEVQDNVQASGDVDARSTSGSILRAQNADWAVGSVECLVLDDDASSVLVVEPLIVNGPPCPPAPSVRGGEASASGKSGGVLLAVLDAEDALAAGAPATAGTILTDALAQPASADERTGVYGGVRRLLAAAQPAGLTADLTARLGGPDRGPALHALAVAAFAAGDDAAATERTDALAAEFAGTVHEVPARSMRVQLAARAGNQADALDRLEALWALAPESDLFVQAAVAVLAAFPDADLDWTGIAFKGGADTSGPLDAPSGLTVWPNPTTGDARVSVPTEPGSTLTAAFYDGLGRRIATLADGVTADGATFQAALPTAGLAPGVYHVRVIVRSESGADTVSVARVVVAE